MAHPLNRAVMDPATRTVVEGYGILQPRVSISTQSAARSWLPALYSGETGFDIYTRAVSDVYQDLFGEGIFTGKGIYEVDAFRESLEQRFPANTLLSHDLIEGLFARAGLVSDIELVDDYPTQFSAYCRRSHRWMRGDWQILRWLLDRVPDCRRRRVANPLGADLALEDPRQSAAQPGRAGDAAAAARGVVRVAAARRVDDAALAVLLAPSYWSLLFAMPARHGGTPSFGRGRSRHLPRSSDRISSSALHFVYLLHDALLAVDAIVRVARADVPDRPAPARMGDRGRGVAPHQGRHGCVLQMVAGDRRRYHRAARTRSAGVAAGGGPAALDVGVERAAWRDRLNQPPAAEVGDLDAADVRFLREHALRTWRFFRTYSTPGTTG